MASRATQVEGGGTNDGEGRAQLVGDAGDEVHLLLGELRGLARIAQHEGDGGKNEEQDRRRDAQVAHAGMGDQGFERAGAVANEEPPAALVEVGRTSTAWSRAHFRPWAGAPPKAAARSASAALAEAGEADIEEGNGCIVAAFGNVSRAPGGTIHDDRGIEIVDDLRVVFEAAGFTEMAVQ